MSGAKLPESKGVDLFIKIACECEQSDSQDSGELRFSS